ncbi:hypothetical protein [Halorubrum gandharaense]
MTRRGRPSALEVAPADARRQQHQQDDENGRDPREVDADAEGPREPHADEA